jgi:hypothetical protein
MTGDLGRYVHRESYGLYEAYPATCQLPSYRYQQALQHGQMQNRQLIGKQLYQHAMQRKQQYAGDLANCAPSTGRDIEAKPSAGPASTQPPPVGDQEYSHAQKSFTKAPHHEMPRGEYFHAMVRDEVGMVLGKLPLGEVSDDPIPSLHQPQCRDFRLLFPYTTLLLSPASAI